MERAKAAGASYADIRINRYRDQGVGLRVQTDRATGKPVEVPSVSDDGSFGFGLRVLADGAWGFSASYDVTRDAIARAAAEAVEIARANAPLRRRPVELAPTPSYRDTYRTKIVTDPFAVPIEQKLELLRAAAAKARAVAGVFSVMGRIEARLEDRFFASTEGSVIEQHVYQIAPEIITTVVESGRKVKSRYYRPHSVCAGYEVVERAYITDHARRIAEEAVAHLKAPSVSPGVKDLVLLPTHLSLTIHESIGHSTELDRALGYEANYAGTSFLTPDKLGKFRVGSEIVNFNGDRTRPESLSTCGYDDDGVKTRQFPIIKAGIFVGYQTIRDQAHLIGQNESMGCCYADSYASVPFQRMPNVWLGAVGAARDARRPGLGRGGRHPDRRPGLVLDRPAAVQLPVRRRRLLGDQGGQGPRHDRRRRLPEPHAGLLGRLRRHRRPGAVGERRAQQRRQGPARPDQRDEPRVCTGEVPTDQRIEDRLT